MIIGRSAGAIIFYVRKGNPIYLLIKYKNYWGFVKGLIEKNETGEKTAVREAKEEANLKISIVPGFKETISFIFKFHGKLIRKFVIFYLAETTKEEAKKTRVSWEHEAFKWLDFDEALKMLKHKNEISMLKKANEFLKNYLKQKNLLA